MFALMDADSDGTVSLQEFRRLTKESSKQWTVTKMASLPWRKCNRSCTGPEVGSAAVGSSGWSPGRASRRPASSGRRTVADLRWARTGSLFLLGLRVRSCPEPTRLCSTAAARQLWVASRPDGHRCWGWCACLVRRAVVWRSRSYPCWWRWADRPVARTARTNAMKDWSCLLGTGAARCAPKPATRGRQG